MKSIYGHVQVLGKKNIFLHMILTKFCLINFMGSKMGHSLLKFPLDSRIDTNFIVLNNEEDIITNK